MGVGGVEGGGSAGAAVSVGPSLNPGPAIGGLRGGLGPSITGFVSEGPIGKFGSLASLGVELKAPSPQTFFNEGLVEGGLKNTMPYQIGMFNPIGSIRFSPIIGEKTALSGPQIGSEPEELSAEAAVVLDQAPRPRLGGIKVPEVFQTGLSDINLDPQSEDLLSETMQVSEITVAGADISPANIVVPSVAKVEPKIVSDASKLAAVRETISGLVVPALEPAIKSKSVLATQVATQPQAEIKVASAPAVQASVVEDQQVEELVEEVVEVKNDKDQLQEENSEASEEIKIQRVVDESAVKERIGEIIAAAVAVQEEGGVIEGQKIVEKLPSQNKKNRSGELNIVDPEGRLLDGSLLATVKKIASGKFASVLDVIKRAPKIVAEDIPVTRGEGQLVTDKDVAKVYEQYKGKIPPAQEVIRRVVKMLKQIKVVKKGEQSVQTIPIHEEIVEKNEGKPHAELAAALLVPTNIVVIS